MKRGTKNEMGFEQSTDLDDIRHIGKSIVLYVQQAVSGEYEFF